MPRIREAIPKYQPAICDYLYANVDYYTKIVISIRGTREKSYTI
jgi:hypothetical protein